jgi:mRNA-degrading endonuclease RelE of RelBE toxin-antitoxin system
MYTIAYADEVGRDLKGLRARDRATILDRIEGQLAHEPLKETRNRKPLPGLIPPWLTEGPVWELRIGEWRVYYDVDEAERQVAIRALRRKPPHATTEDTL